MKLKQAEKVLGWDAGIASLVIILAQICSNEMSDDALCFLAPSSFPKLKGKQDFSHELYRGVIHVSLSNYIYISGTHTYIYIIYIYI